jgi:enoyl-CoA hydratase
MSSVSYSTNGPIGTIKISRPVRRNALNRRALTDLHDAVRRSSEDNLRCLVLTGDEGHFCAGADLTELEDMAFTSALREVLDDLAGLSFPTVAAISGACMGLGVQLALACDLRLATEEARFAVPVAKLGLMVDHWTIRRLSLCVGHSTARWMLLTARSITADTAASCGLVQQLVGVGDGGTDEQPFDPGATVLHEAHELAREIAQLAPLAIAGSKLGLDLLQDGPPVSGTDEADDAYRVAFEAAWTSEDLVEGRHAFRARRAPDFRGR